MGKITLIYNVEFHIDRKVWFLNLKKKKKIRNEMDCESRISVVGTCVDNSRVETSWLKIWLYF